MCQNSRAEYGKTYTESINICMYVVSNFNEKAKGINRDPVKFYIQLESHPSLHGMVDICLVFKFTINGKVFKCC